MNSLHAHTQRTGTWIMVDWPWRSCKWQDAPEMAEPKSLKSADSGAGRVEDWMYTYFPDQPCQTSGSNAGVVQGLIFSLSSRLRRHVLVEFGQRGPFSTGFS
ncbi:uncharacterized protein APUU_11333A [Aspergillus puulaauensis]|uniref:Uncharacterized protein n=1 Tax=Aspergillus puulaauensis TaxID=1220207 RepID=A0A7R8AIC3_9EURO|nr:uncharacterized protein APUU_11333A [Aspergillus puulaauensis]BCS18505.1 hypothetical protein APUU_11333A [Aspergillus puulaauensis]